MNQIVVLTLFLLSSLQAISVRGLPVNDFVFATDEYTVQITLQAPIYLEDILTRFGTRDNTGILAKLRPRLVEVNYRAPADDVPADSDSKAIPVISDIERIKKVIEIIEFVGGKVDQVIESLPTPVPLVSNNDQKSAVNATEVKDTTEAEPNDE